MTSFNRFTDRNRDQQDGYERGLWGEIEYVDGAGAVMTVRGTGDGDGTLDEEVPILNTGFGFNVAKDTDAEVLMLSMNSDTNQKYAVPTLPRDKQRKWPEGSGGVQHPTDPEKAVQIEDAHIWLKHGTFVLGDNKELKITISGGNVVFETSGELDIRSSKLTHNGVDIGETHRHSNSGGNGTGGPPVT
jgi:hypothetical protein